jgi:hypothetical protein
MDNGDRTLDGRGISIQLFGSFEVKGVEKTVLDCVRNIEFYTGDLKSKGTEVIWNQIILPDPEELEKLWVLA